ncbi:hypothetical protein [Massilia horti]|nr:hypothetical protein [Massilia horti]
MSRTSSCLKTLTLGLLAFAGLAFAQQQQQPPQQTPPSEKPPRLETIEPGSDVPATAIPPQRGTQIIEHRNNAGQVTQIEVIAGGSHYFINNPYNAQAGNSLPGDATSAIRNTPQWKLFDFDLNSKKKAASAAEAAGGQAVPAAAEAPPPPRPATE